MTVVALDPDIAFCAGFFEADGCCSIKKVGYCSLHFYNDNKQVLEKIRDVLSVDTTPKPREKPKGGISYTLSICKRENVVRIVELFLSCRLVTVKRENLLKAKEILSRPPHIRVDLWTEGEDTILKNNTGKTCRQVAEILGRRTINAIANRRFILGVKSTSPSTIVWTEDEDNILRNTIDRSVKEVSQILGRTKGAITTRRSHLRVISRYKWTEDEDSIIRNTTDKTVKEVSQILGRRTINAVSCRRHRLRLNKQ